jgi:hypothetical protein
VVEHLEAVPRPYLGQKACEKYRKKKLVPGVLKGLGSGYFDVPIAVRISDLVSFRDRGGFLNREYKLVRCSHPCTSCHVVRARRECDGVCVYAVQFTLTLTHTCGASQIFENQIKYVKPVDLILDQTSMAPEHIVLQAHHLLLPRSKPPGGPMSNQITCLKTLI